ncbi:MAG: hypothetical protein HZA20_01885 [Nitrospirae bacterium]|nr:hypothetical protein [Nitrospirota bacterium]
MANIKTAISMQQSLFDKADTLAREMNISRSHLFVLALEDYLNRHQNMLLLDRINQAYSDEPDAADSSEKERLRLLSRMHRKAVDGTW